MKRAIFYFDDEEALLKLFEETFGHEYDVRTTISLSEARRMLKECAFDIIISDQKMPEIEGTSFLREAAQACPQSYRILLTGQTSMMNVVTEITTGIVQQFMAKPWDIDKMHRALERALAIIEQGKRNAS